MRISRQICGRGSAERPCRSPAQQRSGVRFLSLGVTLDGGGYSGDYNAGKRKGYLNADASSCLCDGDRMMKMTTEREGESG